MGGQHSKPTPEGEAVPPRIRSVLQQRFEEIKIRGKAKKLKASTSKKELLNDGEAEEVDISLPHSLRSSPEFDNVPSPKEPPTMQNKSKVATTLADSEDKGTKPADEDQNKRDGTACSTEDDHKEAKVPKVYIGGVFAMEETTEGVEEDEDNEDDSSRNRELLMCPASPSFRVYCMEPAESENDDSRNYSTDDSHSDEEEIKHKKSPSAESADSNSGSIASTTDHNNGQETKPKNKGRRRRIRKAFSMGGPSAVKNLLNVKGCYYAVGCSGGHGRSAYLAEKSAAT